MKICGIHFAPLFIPLHRRLETFSAFLVIFLFMYFFPVSIIIAISIIFTPFWWLMALYFIWIIIDRKSAETGGHSSKWVQSWSLFRYARNYYPVSVTIEPGVKLNPKRCYIACSFPHGQFPMGVCLGFGFDTKERRELMPHHTMHPVTLNINFFIPFYRELLLALGICNAKKKSIDYLLQTPGGGKVVTIVVGGAAESQYAFGGQYHLVLKNRKGFIKVALQNGSPLLPVFSFGETSLFKQYNFAEGSFGHKIQEWVKRTTGISLNMVYGRGFFQYTFGLLPFRQPINVVVGHPVEVEKIENPTQEDIDKLHKKFIDALTNLFEKHKYKFEKNPEGACLVIV